MKIFDIFKKNKNNQEKKGPIINDRTVNFEIKFDNSKEKYVKTDEGILKISIKNATEIFRQTIKVTNERLIDNVGEYEPHVCIDIMVIRLFKSNNGRYFYDITSSDSEYNCMNYIEGDTMIIINNSSMIPIYEQIVNQVKQNIVDGKLKEGDVLPSVRGLSKDLKISALTVKKAYDILEADGLCRTVQGKGSFVLGVNPGLVHEQRVVEIQKNLEKVLDKAKSYDLSKDEMRDLFEILMEE